MEHVLPGPGFSFGGQNATSATVFRVLGPLPPGLVLDRLEVVVVVNGVTIGSFSPVLTSGSDADAATFDSGASLVTARASSLRGKPAFTFITGGAAVVRFSIPLGLAVLAGSKFVLCGMGNASATLAAFNVSLFTVLNSVSRG